MSDLVTRYYVRLDVADYAIPLLPFLALASASTLTLWIRDKTRPRRVYAAILCLGVAAHIGYGLYASGTNAFMDKSKLVEENALIASGMKRGARVLAPGRFIYNEIGNFEIRDLHAARYLIMNARKREFNLTSLCEYAKENRFEYIILDREYRNFGKIDPEKVYPPVWGYEVIKEYSNGSFLLKEFDLSKARMYSRSTH